MPTWVTGLVVAVAFGFIIWGGRKRIIRFVNVAVPFMASLYLLGTLLVLLVNIADLPEAIMVILRSAFGADQIFGGIVGGAVLWGARRALFSNVAGVGEGTYAAGAADVSHPAKQGLVQAFSIYIDTLCICMATGLMLVVWGRYNVITTDGREIVTNLPGVEAGPNFTQEAIETIWQAAGAPFVAIAISLFALTTIVAFYFIAESNLAYPVRRRDRTYVRIMEVDMVAIVFYSKIQDAALVWATADIGYGALGVISFLALILLGKIALRTLKDYEEQRNAGLDPVFDPKKLGIEHATFWEQEPARQE